VSVFRVQVGAAADPTAGPDTGVWVAVRARAGTVLAGACDADCEICGEMLVAVRAADGDTWDTVGGAGGRTLAAAWVT
jgi:hypothetical protein